MSRFKNLKYYLGFWKALSIYFKLKTGAFNSLRLLELQHPFTIRKNGSDYATFLEVLIKKDYTVPFSFSPKTIIDAGGNIGLTSIFFANQYPGAAIVIVEPDKENFKVLVANTTPYKNIFPFNKGIWTHKAFLNVIDTGRGENSFIVEETLQPNENSVEAAAINEIMEQQRWQGIDLLKIDIEGTEKEIFENNYEKWLPHTKVIFVETHDRMKKGCSAAVFRAVSRYNFSCSIAGENFLFVNEDLVIN